MQFFCCQDMLIRPRYWSTQRRREHECTFHSDSIVVLYSTSFVNAESVAQKWLYFITWACAVVSSQIIAHTASMRHTRLNDITILHSVLPINRVREDQQYYQGIPAILGGWQSSEIGKKGSVKAKVCKNRAINWVSLGKREEVAGVPVLVLIF